MKLPCIAVSGQIEISRMGKAHLMPLDSVAAATKAAMQERLHVLNKSMLRVLHYALQLYRASA